MTSRQYNLFTLQTLKLQKLKLNVIFDATSTIRPFKYSPHITAVILGTRVNRTKFEALFITKFDSKQLTGEQVPLLPGLYYLPW